MDTGKASPHADDLITTRGTARTVFNYMCLFLPSGSHPQMSQASYLLYTAFTVMFLPLKVRNKPSTLF